MTDCVLVHDPAAEALTGLLCGKHFSRLRSTLIELPAVATWLEVNLAAGGVSGERVSGTREDPIPLRQDILDLIGPDSRKFVAEDPPAYLLWEDGLVIGYYGTWQEAQTARVEEMRLAGVEEQIIRAVTQALTAEELAKLNPDKLSAARHRWQVRPTQRGGSDQAGSDSLRAVVMHWARVVNEEGDPEERRFAWPDRNDLIGLVAYLAANLSWIANQPWVDEFAEELRKATSDAHRVAPWRPEFVRVSGACEECGVGAVVANLGEGWRRCEARAGGCGKREDLSEYEYRMLLPETRRAG